MKYEWMVVYILKTGNKPKTQARRTEGALGLNAPLNPFT